MNSRVRMTVEGGLLAAITVILCLGSIYLPVFGVFIEFFCSVPIAILTVRQGEKIGLAAVFVSLALLFIFVGPIIAVRVTMMFGMCGLIFGACLRRELSATKSFIPLVIMSFAAQIFSVAMLYVVLNIDYAAENSKLLTESLERSLRVYESLGVDTSTLGLSKEKIESTAQMIIVLTPLILFLVALLSATGTYITTRIFFRKLRMKFPAPMPPFSQWRFSIFFAYLAGFAAIGVYWGEEWASALLYFVSTNAFFFAALVGAIQGLAVLSFVMNHYKISKMFRVLIFAIFILNFVLLQFIALIGFFDMLFDYRKKLWS